MIMHATAADIAAYYNGSKNAIAIQHEYENELLKDIQKNPDSYCISAYKDAEGNTVTYEYYAHSVSLRMVKSIQDNKPVNISNALKRAAKHLGVNPTQRDITAYIQS